MNKNGLYSITFSIFCCDQLLLSNPKRYSKIIHQYSTITIVASKMQFPIDNLLKRNSISSIMFNKYTLNIHCFACLFVNGMYDVAELQFLGEFIKFH